MMLRRFLSCRLRLLQRFARSDFRVAASSDLRAVKRSVSVFGALFVFYVLADFKAIRCMAFGRWPCLLIVCVLWCRVARQQREARMRETNIFCHMWEISIRCPPRISAASGLLWTLLVRRWRPLFQNWQTRRLSSVYVVVNNSLRWWGGRRGKWSANVTVRSPQNLKLNRKVILRRVWTLYWRKHVFLL